MKNIYIEEFYSIELCERYPDRVFVFGDNLIEEGAGGQAIIRHEPNTFGIPTKRLPKMTEASFFCDQEDEYNAVDNAIEILKSIWKEFDIVFPKHGLGTGLAKMKEKSPRLYRHMYNRLIEEFGYDNDAGTLEN